MINIVTSDEFLETLIAHEEVTDNRIAKEKKVIYLLGENPWEAVDPDDDEDETDPDLDDDDDDEEFDEEDDDTDDDDDVEEVGEEDEDLN